MARRRGAYEVVGEFVAWEVGVGVLEVDDDELLVLVGWQEEGRFSCRCHT